MEHKPVKQKNPFTGRAEKHDKFGPRAKPRNVALPDALDMSVAQIAHETGLSFTAIIVRALARYADWYFKRKATPGVVEQRPAIVDDIIKIDGPDPDPF